MLPFLFVVNFRFPTMQVESWQHFLRIGHIPNSVLAARSRVAKGMASAVALPLPSQFLISLVRNLRLEAELNTRLIPEVALVVVAMRKVVAKAGQQIINLNWPNCDH